MSEKLSPADEAMIDAAFQRHIAAPYNPNRMTDPTQEQIDLLCKAMWGEQWFWQDDCDNDPPHRQSQESRRHHRDRMRSFLRRAAMIPGVTIAPA